MYVAVKARQEDLQAAEIVLAKREETLIRLEAATASGARNAGDKLVSGVETGRGERSTNRKTTAELAL